MISDAAMLIGFFVFTSPLWLPLALMLIFAPLLILIEGWRILLTTAVNKIKSKFQQ